MTETSHDQPSEDRCWRMHQISVAMIQKGYHRSLQDQFEEIFMSFKGPQDMALFSTGVSSESGIAFYFSPGCWPHARALMQAIGAEPCQKPEEKLALLVGHADAPSNLL